MNTSDLVILTREETKLLLGIAGTTEGRTCSEQRVLLRLAWALDDSDVVAATAAAWKYDDDDDLDYVGRRRFSEQVIEELEQMPR